MPELIPSNVEVPVTASDDPRLGQVMGMDVGKGDTPRVALVGFPSDEGVRRNNGRPGAAQAPNNIRKQLYRMTPPAGQFDSFVSLIKRTVDLGNISNTVHLEEAQEKLGEITGRLLEGGTIPVIIGGGHETAYGHFLGYAEADMETTILNIDAHTDVRQTDKGKSHSGSPFRQAIEHPGGYCKKYTVAGLQPQSVAKEHLDYIKGNGGDCYFYGETDESLVSELLDDADTDRLMVTFDMDAVDQSFAPGVSAPCTNGFYQRFWLEAARLAGRSNKVHSFDLVETNPVHDRDDQTVRLAALTIWHFLRGVTER